MSDTEKIKFWSWIKSVLSQGATIQQDYMAGKYDNYEQYSARLDCAAIERENDENGPVKIIAKLEAEIEELKNAYAGANGLREIAVNEMSSAHRAIDRMRPVVEAMGPYLVAMRTKYANRWTAMSERGKAIDALEAAYHNYRNPKP